MVDFNNLLSRFVLAAPRALNDEVAQGQMVVCTQMSIAGSAASFTVKIMNAGTGRDLAEQLAQPLIKGLLGLTASAAELAAATQAEQSVHATKTYTARQTARFYPGWRDWKTAFEQAAAAPRPRTDPPNTGGAGPAAPRPVSILGAPFALEMFRKLPASGSVAAGNVEAAEVLGLCDKMPALGASMLPEAVRIQSFAVALETAAGEAAHTSLRGEISAKGQLTLAEATAFLGRFGQAFKASAPSPAAPTTPYEALVRRVDAGGQFDEFMEKTIPFICTDAAQQRVAEGDQAVFKQMLRDFMSSGLASLPEAGLSALAGGPPMDASTAAIFIMKCQQAKKSSSAQPHGVAPAASAPHIIVRKLADTKTKANTKTELEEDSDQAILAAVSQLDPNAKALVNSLATALESDGSPSNIAATVEAIETTGTGALPSDVQRLLVARRESITHLASSMPVDDQLVASIRSLRRACLRRLELLHHAGSSDKRWDERQLRNVDRIRCGRLGSVDIAVFSKEGDSATGFSATAPLVHFSKLSDPGAELLAALQIFFAIWARAHLHGGYSSAVTSLGIAVSGFFREQLKEGAKMEHLSKYWRELMRLCEGPSLRFERRETNTPLVAPDPKWATDRNLGHVDELLASVRKETLSELKAQLAASEAKRSKGDDGRLKKMEEKMASQAKQIEAMKRKDPPGTQPSQERGSGSSSSSSSRRRRRSRVRSPRARRSSRCQGRRARPISPRGWARTASRGAPSTPFF